MFEGFRYFRNKDGLLPNEQIKADKFDEIWGELEIEFKSKFRAIMHHFFFPGAVINIVVAVFEIHWGLLIVKQLILFLKFIGKVSVYLAFQATKSAYSLH